MDQKITAATLLFVIATLACTQPQPPTPTPGAAVVIPPETISDMATAVAAVGTQAAVMQEAIATAQASAVTPTPTPEESDDSAGGTMDGLTAAGVPPPAVAARLPVVTAADSAPCSLRQIKGNSSSMIFHVPGGGSYARTKASVTCFDTEAQAIAAGFRKARN